MARRLPIYVLIEGSSSVSKGARQTVQNVVSALLSELRSDPQALETVWISVIVFGNTANQVCPLTEVMAFKPPRIKLGGGAALGQAFNLLDECVSREVRACSPSQLGDYKPLVFVLTNGSSSDDWRPSVEQFMKRRPARVSLITLSESADDSELVNAILRYGVTELIDAADLSAGDVLFRNDFVGISTAIED